MWIWPGCPLIGASSAQRTRIQNNLTYVIEEVAADHVVLEGGRKLSNVHVLSLTRPAWCRTIASTQGHEIDEELASGIPGILISPCARSTSASARARTLPGFM